MGLLQCNSSVALTQCSLIASEMPCPHTVLLKQKLEGIFHTCGVGWKMIAFYNQDLQSQFVTLLEKI